MAANTGGRNKPKFIDKESFQTMEELFEAVRGETERFKKQMQKAQRDIAQTQEVAMKRAIERWVKFQSQEEQVAIEHLEAYKKKFLEDRAKQEKEERLKLINDIYKEEVEASKKSTQKRKIQDAINNREDNLAWLKQYAKLESEGTKLTPEQQEDRKRREEELDIAKKSLTAQQGAQLALKAIGATLNQVNQNISTYAKYQGSINARLQGSSMSLGASIYDTLLGKAKSSQDYFGNIETRITNAVGINPYVTTASIFANLDELVRAGIASNVEQRAFLQSVKDDIATTFDVANSSLLRIVRLQQQDSTAARLGMEAYLTRFLNNMVENTEYLTQTFDNVQEALLEASSQMDIKQSTEFEYVVQKWLGALTGTGLSESAATQIAQAMGYLGSGNVSALSNSSMMSLMAMAASRSGLNIGDILNTGLTASSANQLLNAMAQYMVEIGSGGTNVLKSELAQTFGLSISDIKAAQQLAGSFSDINRNMLSYTGMYGSLNQQMMALPGRMSVAEMIQNVADNAIFNLSSEIASNPVLASIWKITDLIESTTGGINIPTISVMGNMVDLNATVEQLMKLGIVGIGSLGMIGDVISGIGSTLAPSSMLQKLGIMSGNTAISRGTGLSSMISGFSTSTSTYVGTGSSSDIYQQTLQSSADEANNNSSLQPQVDEETTKALPNIDKNVAEILNVLNSIRTRLDGEFEVSNDIGNFNNVGLLV